MDEMMSQMAANPKMIEMSMKMLRDMDEETVVKVRGARAWWASYPRDLDLFPSDLGLDQQRPSTPNCEQRLPPNNHPHAAKPQMFSAQSGGAQNEASIRKAVQAMRSMSDNQVQLMAKAASTLSTGAVKLRAARDWLAGRQLLVAALVVLFVAILLRWLGIM
jgi:hypothetical protein